MKLSVSAADLGSATSRRTCFSSRRLAQRPCSARVSGSSSGMLLQMKNDNLDARARSRCDRRRPLKHSRGYLASIDEFRIREQASQRLFDAVIEGATASARGIELHERVDVGGVAGGGRRGAPESTELFARKPLPDGGQVPGGPGTWATSSGGSACRSAARVRRPFDPHLPHVGKKQITGNATGFDRRAQKDVVDVVVGRVVGRRERDADFVRTSLHGDRRRGRPNAVCLYLFVPVEQLHLLAIDRDCQAFALDLAERVVGLSHVAFEDGNDSEDISPSAGNSCSISVPPRVPNGSPSTW